MIEKPRAIHVSVGENAFKLLIWRECLIQGVELKKFEPDPRDRECIVSEVFGRKSQDTPHRKDFSGYRYQAA